MKPVFDTDGTWSRYAFFRALKTRGVPTELNVYPREPHGVSERGHIVDMTEKSLKWLDTWLPVNPSATARL